MVTMITSWLMLGNDQHTNNGLSYQLWTPPALTLSPNNNITRLPPSLPMDRSHHCCFVTWTCLGKPSRFYLQVHSPKSQVTQPQRACEPGITKRRTPMSFLHLITTHSLPLVSFYAQMSQRTKERVRASRRQEFNLEKTGVRVLRET